MSIIKETYHKSEIVVKSRIYSVKSKMDGYSKIIVIMETAEIETLRLERQDLTV